jgi:hypothetical protein
MIGLTVFESDEFLDLPDFAKALYPYIILKADDNGLLNNMKAILRTFNSDERALTKLLEIGFLLNMDNGIYAITHWEQQNHMPSSKFTPTVFTENSSAWSCEKTAPTSYVTPACKKLLQLAAQYRIIKTARAYCRRKETIGS